MLKLKTFKRGGVHPDPDKLTAGRAVRVAQPPVMVSVLLAQSIGAPAKCVVKPLQHVEAGELIGEAGGFISANVHSPVSGTVRKIEPVRDLQGIWRPGVIIEADPEQPEVNSAPLSEAEVEALSAAEVVERVKQAGVVGAGGATFPTHVKLMVPEGKRADFAILNGAECEPYLTCDDSLMRTSPERVISGLRLIMKAVSAPKGIIGIEANKKEAYEILSREARKYPDIEVVLLLTKYPQGGEKQLIYALTKRIVPAGGLPIDVGCVVDNVATAAAISDAVLLGRPFTHRLVTVTGIGLSEPGDFLVPVGTPVSTLIELAGGLPADTGKIIAGGPMMGRAVSYPDAPSTKGLSGVLVVPESRSHRPAPSACIKCGRCVNVCPMCLEPNKLAVLGFNGLYDEAREAGVLNCLECGSCNYICPSHRPILDYIKLSRLNLRKKK